MKKTLAMMLFTLPLPLAALIAWLCTGTEHFYPAMLNVFFPIIPLCLTSIGSIWLQSIDIAALKSRNQPMNNDHA